MGRENGRIADPSKEWQKGLQDRFVGLCDVVELALLDAWQLTKLLAFVAAAVCLGFSSRLATLVGPHVILVAPGLFLAVIKIVSVARGNAQLIALLRETQAVCAAQALPLPAEGLGGLLRQARLVLVSMVGVGLVLAFELVLSVQGFLHASVTHP